MSIEAMKQALKALEDGDYWEKQEAITSLRQAIAEAEQDHSIEIRTFGSHVSFVTREPFSKYKDGNKFYRHPQPKAEQDGDCQHCGGKSCVACDARKQEPVEWGVDWGKAGDVPCVSIIKRKTGGGIEVMAVEYAPYTDPQPKPEDYHVLEQSLTRLQKRYGELEAKVKINPLTVEQLREHWQVAKVLDMTDAEINFADYVLIARDIEALYGIKGEA